MNLKGTRYTKKQENQSWAGRQKGSN